MVVVFSLRRSLGFCDTLLFFQAHLNNLKTKTSEMIVEVNGAIGHQICVGTEDLLVVTGVAGMFTQGNKVKIKICGFKVINYQKSFTGVVTSILI